MKTTLSQDQLDDISRWVSDLNQESDRGAALAATAYLDDSLEELLAASLIPRGADPLLGKGRPLSSFWSRIVACYCMGLISKTEHDDLHTIREIRNHFAHERQPLSFSEQSIADQCLSLHTFRNVASWAQLDTPRSQFAFAASVLLVVLQHRAAEQRLQPRTAPSGLMVRQIPGEPPSKAG